MPTIEQRFAIKHSMDVLEAEFKQLSAETTMHADMRAELVLGVVRLRANYKLYERLLENNYAEGHGEEDHRGWTLPG